MSDDAVAYVYQNIGSFSAPATLGRVVGFAGTAFIGAGYTYQNILTQISGSVRVTDTGDVRVTDDGSRRVI